MVNEKNLETLTEEISENLLEVKDIIYIMQIIAEGERKISPLIDILERDIKIALKNIEDCIKMISTGY